MRMLRSKSGFTIVEMAVVIAILGILASIALPSFQSTIRSQRVKTASFDFYSSMMVARSEAIKRNSDVVMSPITPDSWDGGWQITAGSLVLKSNSALKNIVVEGAPSSITYSRTGRISGGDAVSFEIKDDETDTSFVRCITIELSGMPKTSRGAC